MNIDVSALDDFDFKVSRRGDVRLINPTHIKHVWEEDELHFRSLLIDDAGEVLSSGFPKFFNYGEKPAHDAAFRAALAENRVTLHEKLDGSLIIMSVDHNQVGRVRTRGNHSLGEFAEPVQRCLNQYPKAWILTQLNVFGSFSLLMEYVSPENQIVVKYTNPELYLLAIVDHSDLQVYNSESLLTFLSSVSGIPVAPRFKAVSLESDVLIDYVRSLKGREGVVASYIHEGRTQFLKIKSEEYVRLHSVRFNMEGKGRKLAYLLGIEADYEILPKLASLGIDAEGAAFISGEIAEYVRDLNTARRTWRSLQEEVGKAQRRNQTRKDFVNEIRLRVDDRLFPVAMKMYDNKPEEECWLGVLCIDVLQEKYNVVKDWRIDSLFRPAKEDTDV